MDLLVLLLFLLVSYSAFLPHHRLLSVLRPPLLCLLLLCPPLPQYFSLLPPLPQWFSLLHLLPQYFSLLPPLPQWFFLLHLLLGIFLCFLLITLCRAIPTSCSKC